MKKKFPAVFVLSVLLVILLVEAFSIGARDTLGVVTDRRKGRGLEAFYSELKTLGFKKGEGGAVLFRRSVIQPRCPEAFLRIYVASAPHNVEQRKAIRDTWAAWIRNVTVIFVIGRGDLDIDIAREAEKFGKFTISNCDPSQFVSVGDTENF